MKRLLLGLGALALVTTACESEVTGPECAPVALNTASTAGDTVTLNTGVRYIDVEQGTGTTVTYCDRVLVQYRGTFPGGEVFDPGASPIDSYLGYGGLIPGFEQGLIGLQVGGRRRLIVPPSLAYGGQDQIDRLTGEVVIPANSTLVFDVTLLDHLAQEP